MATTSDKQFTLFSDIDGPNGWKVAAVLEELGLTYETKFLDLGENQHREESYTQYNPNGRVPTLIDHHNKDFVIWESNAIILYLIDKYDPEHNISASEGNDVYTQLQWLFFQASGQGPYYGQYNWFKLYHPEPVPSAVERYKNEIKRVLGVLESVLSKQPWLIGDKPTVADLSFVVWNDPVFRHLNEELGLSVNFPSVAAWHVKLLKRDSYTKVLGERSRLRMLRA